MKNDVSTPPKNEPNSNPIRTQSKPIHKMLKINITPFITTNYPNIHPFPKKKTNPISNPIQTQFMPKVSKPISPQKFMPEVSE